MTEILVNRNLLIGSEEKVDPSYHPARYNFSDPYGGRVYGPSDSLLPVCVPLPSTAVPDVLVWAIGEEVPVFRLSPQQYNYSVVQTENGYFLITTGQVANCLFLDECQDYQLQIGSFFSGVFSTRVDLTGLVRVTLASETDCDGLPYSLGWSQWAYIEAEVGEVTPELFQLSKRDERGRLSVTYARLTDTLEVNIPFATTQLRYALSRLPLLTRPVLNYMGQDYNIDSSTIKTKVNDERFGLATLSLNMSLLNETETGCGKKAPVILGTFTLPVFVCPPLSGVESLVIDCEEAFVAVTECDTTVLKVVDADITVVVTTNADASVITPEMPDSQTSFTHFIAHS